MPVALLFSRSVILATRIQCLLKGTCRSIPSNSVVSLRQLHFTQSHLTDTQEKNSVPEASAVDTTYRSATELVWPATRLQEKYAARVYRAMSAVLAKDSTLREALVENLGFTIKEIRVSPDHSKAFILWDSYNGQGRAAGKALAKYRSKLRAALAHAMAARSVPLLEFRHDLKSAEENEIMRIFKEIEEERKRDEG